MICHTTDSSHVVYRPFYFHLSSYFDFRNASSCRNVPLIQQPPTTLGIPNSNLRHVLAVAPHPDTEECITSSPTRSSALSFAPTFFLNYLAPIGSPASNLEPRSCSDTPPSIMRQPTSTRAACALNCLKNSPQYFQKAPYTSGHAPLASALRLRLALQIIHYLPLLYSLIHYLSSPLCHCVAFCPMRPRFASSVVNLALTRAHYAPVVSFHLARRSSRGSAIIPSLLHHLLLKFT